MSLDDLHLNLRNLTQDDYPQLKQLMDAVYDDIGGPGRSTPSTG